MKKEKLDDVTDNRIYNIILKNEDLYCYICVRRAGSYKASCHPSATRKNGYRTRLYRSWKHNRKKQYKN